MAKIIISRIEVDGPIDDEVRQTLREIFPELAAAASIDWVGTAAVSAPPLVVVAPAAEAGPGPQKKSGSESCSSHDLPRKMAAVYEFIRLFGRPCRTADLRAAGLCAETSLPMYLSSLVARRLIRRPSHGVYEPIPTTAGTGSLKSTG
jgi:hypothetical protein